MRHYSASLGPIERVPIADVDIDGRRAQAVIARSAVTVGLI